MRRLIPGIIMTALWVVLLLAGPAFMFWGLIVCMAGYGLHEYFRMTLNGLTGVPNWLCIAISLLPVAATIVPGNDTLLAALLVSLLGSVLLVVAFHGRSNNSLQYLYACCFGTMYISFCLAHLVLIRYLPHGVPWLLILTAVTAGGDSGAYYIGKRFGRRKLCPAISPGKTVEGAIGGITVGAMAAVGVGLILLPEKDPLLILATGILLSLVSIAGDLTESILKRSAGFKDSGSLLFGHGGVLDRIDSLLIAGPVLYFLLFFGTLL